ncbi:hypothetical protein FNO01nite_25960 [Flavobacterium noncentrifugens]|nr:hypothetical protein FNO01nite_25960 [Flavobacterium noncentrifugens]
MVEVEAYNLLVPAVNFKCEENYLPIFTLTDNLKFIYASFFQIISGFTDPFRFNIRDSAAKIYTGME